MRAECSWSASHSGADIAYEVAAEHQTILSGPDTGQIPASIETRRGRLVFRGLFFLGSHVLTVDTPLGRKMRPHIRHGGAPLLRFRKADLLAAGVERVLVRTVSVQDGLPVLEDGRVLDIENVIWCTGFRRDFSWIKVPFDVGEDGYPVQYRGVASAPGLYFVGLLFLHSFASMLIGGAGRDAERVAKHIASQRSNGRAKSSVVAPPDEDSILVWNGMVTKAERTDAPLVENNPRGGERSAPARP
jgi:putative flavoprotein involved in K+ transport